MRPDPHSFKDKLYQQSGKKVWGYGHIRHNKKFEDIGSRCGMMFPHRVTGDYKRRAWLNDDVLIRMLHKRIGDKWDKVYSHLANNWPKHFREQLDDWIKRWVRFDHNEIDNYAKRYYGFRRDFYIDDNGTFQRIPRSKRTKTKHPVIHFTSGDKEFRKRNGIWFWNWIWYAKMRVDLVQDMHGEFVRCLHDLVWTPIGVLNKPERWFPKHLPGTKVSAVSVVKQCNKKLLRKYDLQNDVDLVKPTLSKSQQYDNLLFHSIF